jgi:hypothetical protein
MVSLIRSGPKILLLETNNLSEFKEYILGHLNAYESCVNTALENSGESYLIIFLVKKLKNTIRIEEIEDVFIIKDLQDEFFCKILNDGKSNLISHARMAPRIILMRTIGDSSKVIQSIAKDFSASIDSFENVLDNSNNSGTVLTFVEKPLNKNVKFKDLYGQALFINEQYHNLIRNLRMHGLKYLNEGIGNKDWFEIEIKIYDIYGAYDLHYKRLMKVLDGLELGIVLGESWGKDTPRFLMTVGIYRLRFFTFYPPQYIKRILVGLEHLEDGSRIVDYDIYFHRKKIDWVDITEKDLKVRKYISKKYRDDIYARLDEDERSSLINLENQIIASRN